MIVCCRDTSVVSQTPSRVTPADKDGHRSGGQKAIVYDLVNFILIANTYVHFKEMERFVREINGVESVKSDSNSNKLEVKGKVDPFKVQKMIKRKTKRKVKLIFPSAEGLTVLKIKLCCNSCNQKLKNDLKLKGLETVEMDMDKDLVTVKGTVNMTELISYMREERNKDVEVVVPAKKDTVATDKKNTETGAIKKKDKDVGPTDKKGKEVGATDRTIREKDTVLPDRKAGKNGGTTVKKGKEVDAADKDSQRKGRAGVPESVNRKKDRHSGHRKNEETSRDGSRRGKNQEVVIGVPVNYSNGYDFLMFSDENPHSCTIL